MPANTTKKMVRRKSRKASTVGHVTPPNANIFADTGLPNADELFVKAELVRSIINHIEQRKLTQSEAANIMGIDQPKVSNLLRGKLSGFSIDRLFRFLTLLDLDVQIVVKQKPRSREKGKVEVRDFGGLASLQ